VSAVLAPANFVLLDPRCPEQITNTAWPLTMLYRMRLELLFRVVLDWARLEQDRHAGQRNQHADAPMWQVGQGRAAR
jgi:hypothetical protein